MSITEPSLGDPNNPYDNSVTKSIDILDSEGNVQYAIAATEWFAEYIFAGRWQVTLGTEPPEPPPADPPPVGPPPAP